MKCPACAETIQNDVEICPFCDTNVREFELPARRSRPGAMVPRKQSRWWIWLLVLGGAGLLIVPGCLLALLLPAVQQAREAARRTQCKNNLKQIALAMHNYHDTFGTFPPAVTYGPDGQPMHSWRVLLLPYLDQAPLYSEYNMNEPWNGPNNSRLLDRMPPMYACPSSPERQGITHYAVPTGAGTMFPPDKAISIREITDGTSTTLLVVETVGTNLNWMAPVDLPVVSGGQGGFSSLHTGGFHAVLADGAVRFISGNLSPVTLDALLTRNKGDLVGDF